MNQEIRSANRRAAWKWGTFVVGLLSLQVAGGVMAIILATSDQSVAIVPDYHEKALNWDHEMATRSASDALGWHCDIRAVDATSQTAGMQILLTDRDRDAIEIREGELKLYRHFRAADVRRVAIPAGSFTSLDLRDCFDASGLWQVSLDITDVKGNRFVDSRELPVTLGQTPAGPVGDSLRVSPLASH